MVEPRTIDNLGLEPSVRWAQDQEYLDKAFIQESPFVSQQTRVDVSAPFLVSEFDYLFQVQQRYRHWALFQVPKGFMEQRMRLFTFQVIPSLGSEELQQAKIDKIRQHVEAKKKRRRQSSALTDRDLTKEDNRDDNESATLLDLLEYLRLSDQLLESINARRSQYSKG
ncbi:MAG: DUF5399 family protein [Chlamydiota bacterium]